jgi:4-hydroxy-tetrahydrodipicolinate synthase
MASLFAGVIVPIITPFDQNEEIDQVGFCTNVEYLIKEGVHGIVVGGSSGEFYVLSGAERKLILEMAIRQANGRIPVYAATGANSVRESLELTVHAASIGAAGTLILPPAFIPPSKEEIIQYYRVLAEATELPICLYNLPNRTKVNLAPWVNDLAALPHVVALKESTNDLLQLGEIIRVTKGKLQVLMGHDLLILPAITMGATGTISPSPNVFGRLTVTLYELAKQGRIEEARRLQYKLFQFRSSYWLGTFPLVLKEAMNIVGMHGGYPRRPTLPLGSQAKESLRENLIELDVFPQLKRGSP